jgi:hypothetical protein
LTHFQTPIAIGSSTDEALAPEGKYPEIGALYGRPLARIGLGRRAEAAREGGGCQ